ncbi:MAG: RNA-directed DNA polymerase [Bacteroidia bacterium]|nr:RNA-directed DNA polymerase [Bacteroidia bacterium]
MTSPLDNILDKAKAEEHSPEYISDITAYAKNLIDKKLPVIFSRTNLALSIGIPRSHLEFLLANREMKYKFYKLRKKHGGYRWISSPEKELKYIQGWIKVNIFDNIEIHPAACGFSKGTSIKKNATAHQKQDLILNIDLYRFFDSITENRVFGILNWLGYHKNIAIDMAKLLCYQPTDKYFEEVAKEGIFSKSILDQKPSILPQGSPASPVISNLLSYKLDVRLSKMASKLGINYSRYADDITFSGERKNMVSLNTVKKIITEEGFYINKDKIKYLAQNRRQDVTGIVVNKGLKINSKYKKKVLTEIYFSEKYGVKNHLGYLIDRKGAEKKANYKDHLLGKIYFIYSVEPEVGKKMLEKYDQIKWEI